MDLYTLYTLNHTYSAARFGDLTLERGDELVKNNCKDDSVLFILLSFTICPALKQHKHFSLSLFTTNTKLLNTKVTLSTM